MELCYDWVDTMMNFIMQRIMKTKEILGRIQQEAHGVQDIKDIINSLHTFVQYHIRTIEIDMVKYKEELDPQCIMSLYFYQGRFIELKYVLEYMRRRVFIHAATFSRESLLQLCRSVQTVMQDIDDLNRKSTQLYACPIRDELFNFIYRSKKRVEEVITLFSKN